MKIAKYTRPITILGAPILALSLNGCLSDGNYKTTNFSEISRDHYVTSPEKNKELLHDYACKNRREALGVDKLEHLKAANNAVQVQPLKPAKLEDKTEKETMGIWGKFTSGIESMFDSSKEAVQNAGTNLNVFHKDSPCDPQSGIRGAKEEAYKMVADMIDYSINNPNGAILPGLQVSPRWNSPNVSPEQRYGMVEQTLSFYTPEIMAANMRRVSEWVAKDKMYQVRQRAVQFDLTSTAMWSGIFLGIKRISASKEVVKDDGSTIVNGVENGVGSAAHAIVKAN